MSIYFTKFIAIEGLDTSGTSTQSRNIAEYYENRNIRSNLMSQPSNSPAGVAIRSMFDLSDDSIDRQEPCFSSVLKYLFLADRSYSEGSSSGTANLLASGTNVIMCRYVLSSAAYNSISDSDVERVLKANSSFIIPDVTFYLKTPLLTCLSRLNKRDNLEAYENPERLAQVEKNYDTAIASYPGKVVSINCDGLNVNQVFSEIIRSGEL